MKIDSFNASEDISFGSQPTLDDFKALAAKGIKTIINTFSHREDQDELSPERAKTKAEALGMSRPAMTSFSAPSET